MTASFIRRAAGGRFGTVSRTVLFLPQIIPLVAAGIMWNWVLAKAGTVNQLLRRSGSAASPGPGSGTSTGRSAVGFIGIWVLLGLTTLLLLAGVTKIDPPLFEAARIDGASAFQEFRRSPCRACGMRSRVCLTVTVILALVGVRRDLHLDQRRPRLRDPVPGLKIYILAFVGREVGIASALAIVLIGSCSSRSCPSSVSPGADLKVSPRRAVDRAQPL